MLGNFIVNKIEFVLSINISIYPSLALYKHPYIRTQTYICLYVFVCALFLLSCFVISFNCIAALSLSLSHLFVDGSFTATLWFTFRTVVAATGAVLTLGLLVVFSTRFILQTIWSSLCICIVYTCASWVSPLLYYYPLIAFCL